MYSTPSPHIHRKVYQPCYGCEERQVGCHSRCERFADYRAALENEKRAARNANVMDYRIDGYQIAITQRKRRKYIK